MAPTATMNYTEEMNRTLTSPEFASLLDAVEPSEEQLEFGTDSETTRAHVEYVLRAANFSRGDAMFLDAVHMHVPVVVFRKSTGVMASLVGAMFGGLILAEVFPLLLAVATIRYLRQNATSFSPQTYRMHLQLILLLVIQV